MRTLSPWVKPQASECTPSDTTALVRYSEPLDGRVWTIDGSPRWIAMVSSCCGPNFEDPERPYHYCWTVDKSVEGGSRDIEGDSIRASFADALDAADTYMLSLGWFLAQPEAQP